MGQFKGTPECILILDDSSGCREAWELLCTELWPSVLCYQAETVSEALNWLGLDTVIDLVLSDLSIPGSPPRQTVESLVEACPLHVPIVLLSGSVVALEGYEMLRLGADSFCLKGSDINVISQCLYRTWVRSIGRRRRIAKAVPLISHVMEG